MSVTNEHGADIRNTPALKTAKAGAASVVVVHKVKGWASRPEVKLVSFVNLRVLRGSRV